MQEAAQHFGDVHAYAAGAQRGDIRSVLVTVKIIAAIHWEALRLWIKGAKLIPHLRAADAKEPTTSLASGKSRAYISEALTDRGGALWSGGGRWARPFTTREQRTQSHSG
jgi:hypothetical protein